MMISKSFMPSVLMMAISTAMVGCGGPGATQSGASDAETEAAEEAAEAAMDAEDDAAGGEEEEG